jgi:hypothetical protein
MEEVQPPPRSHNRQEPSILLCLTLSIITLALSPLQEVSTGADAAWYIANSLNIYQGRGYVDTDWTPVLNRGPVFPFLIATSFTLFGPSVQHAVWVVRVFFVLSIMLVYLLGLRFYGKWPGFIAALLVLTSYQINRYASYVLVDVVLPFFILLFIYCLSWAFERKTLPWFPASGAILGIAFLVKEMAIVFAPLPFLAMLVSAEHRHRRELLLALVSLGGFGLILLPWVIHVLQVSDDIAWLLGGAGPKVLAALSGSGNGGGTRLVERLIRYGGWLVTYYRDTIAANFPLAPFFLIAWIWTLVKGVIDRKPGDKLMLLAFLCFSPIMLFQGKEGWRVGQSLFMAIISYILVARTVWDLVREGIPRAGSYVERHGGKIPVDALQRYGGALLVVLLVALQLARPEAIGYFVTDTQVGRWGVRALSAIPGVDTALSRLGTQMVGEVGRDDSDVERILGSTDFYVRGWHNDTVQEAGQWIANQVRPNTPLISEWQWQSSLYFFAGGDYPIYGIPYQRTDQPGESVGSPVLFLWSYKSPNVYETDLMAMTEGDLLDRLEESGARYVIVTWRRNFLSLYFEAHPGFVKVAEFGDAEESGEIDIFSVEDPYPLEDFPLHLGNDVTGYLQELQATDEAAYQLIAREFFVEQLGWTEEEVQRLMEGDIETVTVETYRGY